MAIARDKFWLFGVRAHQDDVWLGPAGPDSNRKFFYSRITPAEGAFILDVPNLVMVICDGEPANFSHEAYGYAESFCRLKNVQWSCSGSGGFRSGNEEEFVCRLAEEYPNICGAYLDDFIDEPYIRAAGDDRQELARRAKQRLEEISGKLAKATRPMDLHCVYYSHVYGDLDPSVFEKVTMLSMWTWNSAEIPNMEKNFAELERRFPDKKKMIGLYMFDFRAGHPIPNELMQHQCEFGLRMLQEGRADGLIFEANSLMGMRMESELWLRKWIEEHKNTPVPDGYSIKR